MPQLYLYNLSKYSKWRIQTQVLFLIVKYTYIATRVKFRIYIYPILIKGAVGSYYTALREQSEGLMPC